jgi:hypothetical protein
MDHEVGPWKMAFVNGPTSLKIVLRALGPSLGVNRMSTKKKDHAPKSECADFFYTCPKRGIYEKNSSLTILLSSLGLHLSSLLVKCVDKVACKSSHKILYKNQSAI